MQFSLNVEVSEPPVECEVFYAEGWQNQESFYGVCEQVRYTSRFIVYFRTYWETHICDCSL